MKNQHVVLCTTVKLFLDLLKPVRIHQPDHPEDSVEGETPDVSHTVKDRNKVIPRQLNYTWLPTPMGENLKGIISPTALKSCSMAGFTNLQKAAFLPSPILCPTFQGFVLSTQPRFSPPSVRGRETHLPKLPLLGVAGIERCISPVNTVLLVWINKHCRHRCTVWWISSHLPNYKIIFICLLFILSEYLSIFLTWECYIMSFQWSPT